MICSAKEGTFFIENTLIWNEMLIGVDFMIKSWSPLIHHVESACKHNLTQNDTLRKKKKF